MANLRIKAMIKSMHLRNRDCSYVSHENPFYVEGWNEFWMDIEFSSWRILIPFLIIMTPLPLILASSLGKS